MKLHFKWIPYAGMAIRHSYFRTEEGKFRCGYIAFGPLQFILTT
jgi:hypothetical protein